MIFEANRPCGRNKNHTFSAVVTLGRSVSFVGEDLSVDLIERDDWPRGLTPFWLGMPMEGLATYPTGSTVMIGFDAERVGTDV